ncbi:MAG: hypothetical protein LBR87_07400 [Synergistaceae bacterium]|jgi:hypothetical protein|nr:hypothetical protein [Synergistaceae bacterium]
MDAAGILEMVMIFCFGAAWPASIAKSWRSRTAKGKSLFFLLIILSGYAAGITKVIISEGSAGFLLIPYILNAVMVSADLMIYFRNTALDKAEQPCP